MDLQTYLYTYYDTETMYIFNVYVNVNKVISREK